MKVLLHLKYSLLQQLTEPMEASVRANVISGFVKVSGRLIHAKRAFSRCGDFGIVVTDNIGWANELRRGDYENLIVKFTEAASLSALKTAVPEIFTFEDLV